MTSSSRNALALVMVAVFIAGCARAISLPVVAPTATASPSVPAVALETPLVTQSSAPTRACGERSVQAVYTDMVGAPPLPMTKADFAIAWNKGFSDAEKEDRLGDWTAAGLSGAFQGYAARIPKTGTERQMFAIENSSGQLSSIALTLSPNQGEYATPLVTGRFLETVLGIFGQSPALLRQLGVSTPFNDYGQLEGANACALVQAWTEKLWMRLVQVTDGSGEFYFYVREATETETQQWSDQPEPSSSIANYAYPPLNQDSYADFAPPLPSIPDMTGNPDASHDLTWITPIPSSIIQMTDRAWPEPFLATITPVPGGSTIYRHPDTDGTPLFRMSNPFDVAQIASGVDPLLFVGGDSDGRELPPAARMTVLLIFIVNKPTGEGLFFLDGKRIACSWTGGTAESPKSGFYRDSVRPTCRDLP